MLPPAARPPTPVAASSSTPRSAPSALPASYEWRCLPQHDRRRRRQRLGLHRAPRRQRSQLPTSCASCRSATADTDAAGGGSVYTALGAVSITGVLRVALPAAARPPMPMLRGMEIQLPRKPFGSYAGHPAIAVPIGGSDGPLPKLSARRCPEGIKRRPHR